MKFKLKLGFCICGLFTLGFSQLHYTYVSSSNSFDATAFNNSHKIASPDFALPGDSIHVVYHSQDSILYTYTTDFGQSWQTPALLDIGNYPGIDLDLYGFRHIVWQSPDTITGAYDIYYDCLDDYSPPINISETPNNSIFPDIVVDTLLTAHIVWVEDVASYNQIYYRPCHAGILGDTVRLSDFGTAQATSTLPSISIFQPNHRIYVLWDCFDPQCYSPYQIHQKYLEDSTWSSTETWASYLTLRHSSLDFCHGSDSISGAWEDSTSGNLEAFFLGGNPSGGYATSGLSYYPIVSTIGSIWSYLFWDENTSGFEDIYYHLYYFMTGWSEGTVRSVFNIDEQVRYPSCCGSFLIWTQGQSPPYDIYFADFGYPIGIKEMEHLQPQTIINVQPNPFKDKTTIIFNKTQYAQSMEINIYDATGRLVKFLSVPDSYCLVPGAVSWDGTDFQEKKLPAGTYFCTTQVNNERVLLKIVKVE
ncbi:MAG: T9SS type A sorting domain-containing protein [bacterium]